MTGNDLINWIIEHNAESYEVTVDRGGSIFPLDINELYAPDDENKEFMI